MTKIKSIPKADVEKLIKYVQSLQEGHNESLVTSPYMAYGYAKSGFEGLIKKLKGEYPI